MLADTEVIATGGSGMGGSIGSSLIPAATVGGGSAFQKSVDFYPSCKPQSLLEIAMLVLFSVSLAICFLVVYFVFRWYRCNVMQRPSSTWALSSSRRKWHFSSGNKTSRSAFVFTYWIISEQLQNSSRHNKFTIITDTLTMTIHYFSKIRISVQVSRCFCNIISS